jgi:hypothetical protein
VGLGGDVAAHERLRVERGLAGESVHQLQVVLHEPALRHALAVRLQRRKPAGRDRRCVILRRQQSRQRSVRIAVDRLQDARIARLLRLGLSTSLQRLHGPRPRQHAVAQQRVRDGLRSALDLDPVGFAVGGAGGRHTG